MTFSYCLTSFAILFKAVLLHSKVFRLVFSDFRKTVPFPAHLETVADVRNKSLFSGNIPVLLYILFLFIHLF